MQVPSTSNKFYKNSLPAIISTRSKLQKVKRQRKKVIIFKVKNKHWRP